MSPVDPSPSTSQLLESGDVRFLAAQGARIDRLTLSGEKDTVLELEDDVVVVDLTLSPDGQKIAFIAEWPAHADDLGRIDYGSDVYVSDADGSNVQLVVAHDTVGDYFASPAWLDESTLIVGWAGFDLRDGSFNRIEALNVASGERDILLRGVIMGSLAPDRGSLVYNAIDLETRDQELVVGGPRPDDASVVLVDKTMGLGQFTDAVFSPDGSQIAFAAVDLVAPPPPVPSGSSGLRSALVSNRIHPSAQDIWVINRDGTDLHRAAEFGGDLLSITWSGDGRHLYLLAPGSLWRVDLAAAAAGQLVEIDLSSLLWLEGS